MDRRSFVRSMFLACGAVVTGAALLPREAQAASLLDTLKEMEAPVTEGPLAKVLDPDMPAPGAQEAQVVVVRRRRRGRVVVVRRRARARRCVTRIGPRGRIRRVCRIG